MRSGLVGTGIVFLALGILMVLFLWPMVGFETKDTFSMEDVMGGETIRYVGEITSIDESGEIFVLELDNGEIEAYTKEEDFELKEKVFVTIKFGNNVTNWDENNYEVQKMPTIGGSLGAIFSIFGSVLLIVGIATRKRKLIELVKFTAEPPAQDIQIEQVTCPKCKKVFGIVGIARPAKISCPECGLEGTVQ
ncbi:MAG: hypothetical protein V3U20_06440 [Thermoplasmata archaeon]